MLQTTIYLTQKLLQPMLIMQIYSSQQSNVLRNGNGILCNSGLDLTGRDS